MSNFNKVNISSIEEAIKRCKELIKPEHSNWIGLTNQSAIKIILGNLEALCDMQKSADKELENAKKINEEHKKENEKLREKVKELEEYIFIAPDLDEMTATKYTNIQREAYFRGRAEEQQKAKQIIYENYIPKQKIKDKIEEIKQIRRELGFKTYLKREDMINEDREIVIRIKVLEELLQEKNK